eukprot:7314090-Pyramimonas_sp.AAC.1
MPCFTTYVNCQTSAFRSGGADGQNDVAVQRSHDICTAPLVPILLTVNVGAHQEEVGGPAASPVCRTAL